MVDLHIHTINSSGTDSLEEILKKAEEAITKLVKENGEVVDFKVEE